MKNRTCYKTLRYVFYKVEYEKGGNYSLESRSLHHNSLGPLMAVQLHGQTVHNFLLILFTIYSEIRTFCGFSLFLEKSFNSIHKYKGLI